MSQETINTVVTMDTIAELVVVVVLVVFGICKLIDYIWFCRKAGRGEHGRDGNNPLE